jgi:hypothetical protein
MMLFSHIQSNYLNCLQLMLSRHTIHKKWSTRSINVTSTRINTCSRGVHVQFTSRHVQFTSRRGGFKQQKSKYDINLCAQPMCV